MSDVDSIREVLRALAEVRDGPFKSLHTDLTYRIQRPLPQINFRIYQVADSKEAYLVVGVSATRPDGEEVSWSLSIETSAGSLIVTAAVEVSYEQGYRQVFERSESTTDSRQAASLIHAYAVEVCRERRWFEDTNESTTEERA